MVRLSASSLNNMSKCELSFVLSKSPEGRELAKNQPKKWALTNGSIIHAVCQDYDIDRFNKKLDIPKTDEEIFRRYHQAYINFFTDEKILKKENINKEQQELMLTILLPSLKRWLFEPVPKEAAQILYLINSNQAKLKWQFTSRKPLSWYYQESYEIFTQYVKNNQLDIYGTPIEFEIEKLYDIEYGDDSIVGYVDGRSVYSITEEISAKIKEVTGQVMKPGKKVFLREMKTSATHYTPEDCQIDNQMSLYSWYETLDSGLSLDDIYVVMQQLPTGVCTLTQRTQQNIDFLLRHVDERLKRLHEIEDGLSMPLPKCGTNSYDHSLLMCDQKSICPVWSACQSQPKAIVLGKVKEKKEKNK